MKIAIEQKPFRTYTLEEERKWKPKQDTFTVRLNEEERYQLTKIKKALNIKSDSKALKKCAFIGKNALFSIFGEKFLTYLFKEGRVKLEE